MKKKIPIMDVYLSAFLSMQGQQPELSKQGSRVIFEFPATKEVFTLCKAFNENPSVPVIEYVKSVRQIKARMFSMKEERQ